MHVILTSPLLLLLAAAVSGSAQNSDRPSNRFDPLPSETPVEYWDRAYSDPSLEFNTAPNAFLTEVVKGLEPGRALDIGMGEGRNAVYLARLGWDVTGFDISERGMELARKSAAAAGVEIATVNATLEDFDYGADQWDLILGIYVGVAWLDAAVRGLEPGGFLVVEAYAAHPYAPAGAAFGPNELLVKLMERGLEIVRYEDTKDESDWLKINGVVRAFARKPE